MAPALDSPRCADISARVPKCRQRCGQPCWPQRRACSDGVAGVWLAWELRSGRPRERRRYAMLRITVRSRAQGTTVTLEGRLVGAWVEELSACWRGMLASEPRPIQLDLDGVTFIDAGGKTLLRDMHADGIILAATTVMMRPLVDEIQAAQ